ncbi:MAG: hypothetical protein WC307_05710 [Candidatus Nanoarchaeia archaeon]|jgi:hypothetical protein
MSNLKYFVRIAKNSASEEKGLGDCFNKIITAISEYGFNNGNIIVESHEIIPDNKIYSSDITAFKGDEKININFIYADKIFLSNEDYSIELLKENLGCRLIK